MHCQSKAPIITEGCLAPVGVPSQSKYPPTSPRLQRGLIKSSTKTINQ